MPVSRKQFKAGVNAESLKVLEFLFNNREKAFTEKELSEALKIGLQKIQKLLIGLNQRGYVDVGIVGDVGYFAVSEAFVIKAAEKAQANGEKPLGQPFPLHPNPVRDHSEEQDKTRYIG